jgi:hypothetical protein
MSYTNGLDKPSDYFNTNLWTGDDSNPRSITSTHATDFVWIKSRNQTYIHRLFDSVRGATKRLRSNGTDAEDTASNEVTAFTSTGYTIDSGINSTAPTTNWVGWSWLAGGTASSNTSGSITSTVSANTTSGFSIVSYTGTGSASTVGHGLGSVPACYFIKQRNTTGGWIVYHKGNTSSPETEYLRLDKTDATVDDAIFNDTLPTSSVFSIGTNAPVNTSSGTYIAYCFAEKKGFSKFGSYTGNGNADGTFVYTGFRPAFLIVKRTNASNNWHMYDNKRDTYNVADAVLYPNLSNAEGTDTTADFLSNGFKLRTTVNFANGSGDSYIYMCFAENPFVTSGGIPTTAR